MLREKCIYQAGVGEEGSGSCPLEKFDKNGAIMCIWAATWDFKHCGLCDQQSLRSACAYAQSDHSLCLSHDYSLTVKLLTEHHLEFLSLKGGCTGWSESALVKMPHCWKSHVTSHLCYYHPKINNFTNNRSTTTKKKNMIEPWHVIVNNVAVLHV